MFKQRVFRRKIQKAIRALRKRASSRTIRRLLTRMSGWMIDVAVIVCVKVIAEGLYLTVMQA